MSPASKLLQVVKQRLSYKLLTELVLFSTLPVSLLVLAFTVEGYYRAAVLVLCTASLSFCVKKFLDLNRETQLSKIASLIDQELSAKERFITLVSGTSTNKPVLNLVERQASLLASKSDSTKIIPTKPRNEALLTAALSVLILLLVVFLVPEPSLTMADDLRDAAEEAAVEMPELGERLNSLAEELEAGDLSEEEILEQLEDLPELVEELKNKEEERQEKQEEQQPQSSENGDSSDSSETESSGSGDSGEQEQGESGEGKQGKSSNGNNQGSEQAGQKSSGQKSEKSDGGEGQTEESGEGSEQGAGNQSAEEQSGNGGEQSQQNKGAGEKQSKGGEQGQQGDDQKQAESGSGERSNEQQEVKGAQKTETGEPAGTKNSEDSSDKKSKEEQEDSQAGSGEGGLEKKNGNELLSDYKTEEQEIDDDNNIDRDYLEDDDVRGSQTPYEPTTPIENIDFSVKINSKTSQKQSIPREYQNVIQR